MSEDAPLEVDVREARRLMEEPGTVVLDIREPWELEVARIEGTLDIPMNAVPERVDELADAERVLVLCRSGRRSLNVTQWLRAQGMEGVSNIAGGILAWSDEIDSSLAKY